MRRDNPGRPWHLYLLGAIAIAVAVLAVVEIGPPSSSARTSREVVTAEDGVVQSSVTGTGNVEPATDLDVNFRTSGTLSTVNVSVGQHVTKGQLIATLDPTAAQLALNAAKADLTAAEDQLTEVENGTATGGGSASSTGTSATGASLLDPGSSPEFVSYTKPTTRPTTRPTTTTVTTTTVTVPARTAPSTTGSSGGRGGGSFSSTSSGQSPSSSSTTTKTSTTPSPSSIASAEASIDSAEESVQNAQLALNETRLYAPASGTVVSLAGLLPGDSVSAGSSADAASTSSSSGSSSSITSGSGGFSGGSSTAGSLGSSSSSSSSSGSSSSPFAEIVNTGTMTMTVAFSESDISKIRDNQPATVTLDALPGVELAGHISQISEVGSSSSGVVSYNATITLDQSDPQVKPGMSASASVIVSQAQGVTLPNEAVTGTGSLGTVNLLQNGKTVSKQVVVGLRGDSRTQIISGLSAGQQVVVTIALPSLNSSPTSSTSGSSGTLGGGRFGGLGGGGLLGGGAAAFFRGGGGLAGGGGAFRGGGGG